VSSFVIHPIHARPNAKGDKEFSNFLKAGCIFYSDNIGGADALADTVSPPGAPVSERDMKKGLEASPRLLLFAPPGCTEPIG